MDETLSYSVTILMKAAEQYYPMHVDCYALEVGSAFESVDQILVSPFTKSYRAQYFPLEIFYCLNIYNKKAY